MAKQAIWKKVYNLLCEGYTIKMTPNGKYTLIHPSGGHAMEEIPRQTINALEDKELIEPIAFRAKVTYPLTKDERL